MLKKVCIDIASEADADKAMIHVTDWVANALEAEICALFLRDETEPGGWVVLRQSYGYSNELRDKWLGKRTHRMGQGITGHIVQTEQHEILNSPDEVRKHPAWEGKLDQERAGQCKCLLGVAIRFRDEPAVGTLKLENKRPSEGGRDRYFTDEDRIVLETICGVLAVKLKMDEVMKDVWRADNIARFFHTFRSPLFTLRGTCEMIRSFIDRGDPVPDLERKVSLAYTSAMRFQQLVNNSAFWTMKNPKPEVTDVNLCKLVYTVIDAHKEYGALRNIKIEFLHNALPSARTFRSDQTLLELILANLLQNSMEYGRGHIRVKLWAKSSHFVLDVEDDGPGMTREEKRCATQAYFRGAASKGEGGMAIEGLGLGLSVCERAAQCLNGQLKLLKGNKFKGLLVQVTIPCSASLRTSTGETHAKAE